MFSVILPSDASEEGDYAIALTSWLARPAFLVKFKYVGWRSNYNKGVGSWD